MTLRRFPWKIPQNTDNSWKLFAAEPTPGHDPAKLVQSGRRLSEQPGSSGEEESKKDRHREHGRSSHHGHHGHNRHESTATVDAPEAAKDTPKESQAASTEPSHGGERKEVIRGPWRILRLLPRESRYIIWRMLDINPKTRATMEEILSEPWVADSLMCQQTDSGEVIHAEDHTHVLQPPNNPAPAT